MLVSVVVISYNNGRFIREALESIRNQTYPEIQLIVSDDGSTDDSPVLVRDWVRIHGRDFCSVKMIFSPQNRGTSANCNTGVRAADGEYVKIIAADDMLLPDCLEKYVAFVEETGAEYVHGRVRIQLESVPQAERNARQEEIQRWADSFFLRDQLSLRMFLTGRGYILAPSLFFRKKSLIEMGGFDERFPLMEDDPFYLKLLREGRTISALDTCTVVYRIYQGSVCNSGETIRPDFFSSRRDYFFSELIPELVRHGMLLHAFSAWISIVYQALYIRLGNRKTVCTRLLVLIKVLDPLRVWRKVLEPVLHHHRIPDKV